MKNSSALLVALSLLLAGAASAGAEASSAALSVRKVSAVTILVKDQNEALAWYAEKLGFVKKYDLEYAPGQRWLTVTPKDQPDLEIVFEKVPAGKEGLLGKNGTWLLETGDCQRDYEILSARGVEFLMKPNAQEWGVQATFKDLYGNLFTLVGPPPATAN